MKADRFEYVLQKGTELGVSRFVPIISERTVARNVVSPNRLTRWGKIIREAAEQAGRSSFLCCRRHSVSRRPVTLFPSQP